MADRKSLLSRFWPPPSSRRTSTTQPAAPPPATTTSTPSAKPSSQTSPTTAPPPRAAARQSTVKATSPPTPATPPRTESRKDDQPNIASSPETSKSSSPSPQSKDEPKISSPSRATTRSPPSSKPASPSRLPAQSRTPPQPSSPSHAAPQARSTLASPSRVGYQTPQSPSTPKRASKPHSPSRVTSRSPKQGTSSSPKGKQPASPSKESPTPAETLATSSKGLILASKENDPKPSASQQEPEMKEEVTTDSAEGQTQEGKIFEHGNATTTPAEGNQGLYSSTVNGREELDAKPEETKDVKEVMQARNSEANEETKKEVSDPVTPTHTVEKAEIPSEVDHIHREKPEAIDTKEILDKIHREKPEAIDTKEISATTAHDGKYAPPNGERVPLHKNIRADVSKFANQMSMGDPKRAITDRHVSVITLAGENRGASMQMETDSSKREGPVHIHRSYKINPDDSPEATTDGEENSEGKKSEDVRSTDDQLTEAFVNNNAQGINNSIVFNSSITEGSPGVHMIVNHLPKELIQSKDKISSSETRKAEVNTSRAEKLTYQPTVRRRCLRGLLLETSDSDPENPEKPRRHGCRVGCQKGERENDIDVL